MTIKELNKAVASHSQEDLLKIIKELYKVIPKKKKEEKKLDELIKTPSDWGAVSVAKEAAEEIDVDFLYNDICLFEDDVRSSYYGSPNRYISKKRRSGWRFEVMRFIKGLQEAQRAGIKSPKLGIGAQKLFTVLCVCESYTLLASPYPFEVIKFEKLDFFTFVLDLKRGVITWREYIRDGIDMLTADYYPLFTSHLDLMRHFTKTIQYPELSEMAIEMCIEKLKTTHVNPFPNKKYHIHDPKKYRHALVHIIFYCYLNLYETEKAVSSLIGYLDLQKSHDELDFILWTLRWAKLDDDFKRLYDHYVNNTKKGITFSHSSHRERLK